MRGLRGGVPRYGTPVDIVQCDPGYYIPALITPQLGNEFSQSVGQKNKRLSEEADNEASEGYREGSVINE